MCKNEAVMENDQARNASKEIRYLNCKYKYENCPFYKERCKSKRKGIEHEVNICVGGKTVHVVFKYLSRCLL
jgi:hypothetical protein